MSVYFIPLSVNLTKNSKLEKFVHELNALWKLSGSSMGALRELIAVAGINVNGETSFIDPGKELSLQGGVEMNNATSLEGSSVILEEQNIEQDGENLLQDLLTMVDFNNDDIKLERSQME